MNLSIPFSTSPLSSSFMFQNSLSKSILHLQSPSKSCLSLAPSPNSLSTLPSPCENYHRASTVMASQKQQPPFTSNSLVRCWLCWNNPLINTYCFFYILYIVSISGMKCKADNYVQQGSVQNLNTILSGVWVPQGVKSIVLWVMLPSLATGLFIFLRDTMVEQRQLREEDT